MIKSNNKLLNYVVNKDGQGAGRVNPVTTPIYNGNNQRAQVLATMPSKNVANVGINQNYIANADGQKILPNTMPTKTPTAQKTTNTSDHWDNMTKNTLENYSNGVTNANDSFAKWVEMNAQRANDAVQQQNERKDIDQQNASIMLDKLSKYLNDVNTANGYTGQSASNGAALKANANYQNTMATIANNYSSNVASIRENELNNKMTAQENLNKYLQQLETQKYTDLQNIEAQRHEETLNKQNTLANYLFAENGGVDQAFSSVMDEQQQMSQADYDKVANSLREQYKDSLSPEQQKMLDDAIEYQKASVRSKEEQDKIDAEIKAKTVKTVDGVKFKSNGVDGGLTDGDNFRISDGSEKGYYKIQSGGVVSDSDIINKSQNLPNDAVFGYNGNIYLKKNGKIYLVEARPGEKSGYNNLYQKMYGDKTPTTTPTTTTTTATPSTPTETEIEEARKIINIEHPQESQKRLKEKFPNKTDEEIKELVRLATGIK